MTFDPRANNGGASDRRYRPPIASYRLQLHAGFGFADARRFLPYFEGLGISHLYCSPFFRAAPGSTHGYDVLDHNQVNPELGGLAALYELGDELRARDMGLIADIVPNHVGLASGANPWWRDLLRHGRDSRWANYFDINWEAQPHMAPGVLVYPILGQPFGAALEAGELRLALVENDLALCYYDHQLPLAPQSYPDVVGLPPLDLRAQLSDPAALSEWVEIVEALPGAGAEQVDLLLGRFRSLLASEPAIAVHVRAQLDRFGGEVGRPETFDPLEALLRRQHYRLAYWRVSGEEINYRRFFDINELAAIRVERADVFEETHRLLFDLVRGGIVTGVRVDHVDGLYAPAEYLERLRDGLREASAGVTAHDLPIYVEKILERDESLPGDWPVTGTTGYEFLSRVDGLFIDRSAAREMTQTYDRFIGAPQRFPDIVYGAKRGIARQAFAGEINVLASQLHRLAQRHRLYRDETLRSFRRAIEAVMATFPVYRTYLVHDHPGEPDRQTIERAVSEARRREPDLSTGALGFLATVLLLGQGQERDLDPAELEQWTHFRRRFQQLSGPVMAKGFEDTALYRYNRLVSLNEVGNDPSGFGMPAQEVHRWFAERARTMPSAMSTSSTHDTKRGEDTRARLHVLAEVARVWRREVRSWSRQNRRHRAMLQGEPVPDPNTEYLIYQTLVGSWPDGGAAPDDAFRARLSDYLTKAMREMKVATSWLNPDDRYEAACQEFLAAILDPARSSAFLGRVAPLVRSIELAGAINSLGGLVLKTLAPGSPDFYQGAELWARTLTDPDNRRPVDFALRHALLAGQSEDPPGDLTAAEVKLWLTRRLLRVRADRASVLAGGVYQPLATSGAHADHLFAFARYGPEASAGCLVVVVPRLTMRLIGEERMPPLGARWDDTAIELPEVAAGWRDELTGATLPPGSPLTARDLFTRLPFAVLSPLGPRGGEA